MAEKTREPDIPNEAAVMPPPDRNTPVLELDTRAGPPRRKVAIDGVEYELRHLDELSLQDRLRFTRRASKLATLGGLDPGAFAEIDDATIEDLERALYHCTKAVLMADDEVLRKLTATQQMRIMAVFTPTPETADDTRPAPDSPTPTGVYRLSKGSSEGTGATG